MKSLWQKPDIVCIGCSVTQVPSDLESRQPGKVGKFERDLRKVRENGKVGRKIIIIVIIIIFVYYNCSQIATILSTINRTNNKLSGRTALVQQNAKRVYNQT